MNYIVRIQKADSVDEIAFVRSDDIERFMNEYCKETTDKIDGYEYQRIQTMKNESIMIMACGNILPLFGTWVEADDIEMALKERKKGNETRKMDD